MFTKQQKEILDGLMLGDGHLSQKSKNGNAHLSITRNIKDKNYLLYHHKIFNTFCSSVKSITERQRKSHKNENIYSIIELRTEQNSFFGEQHKRWYINKIKTIPNDLILTPTTIATWLADDGCIRFYKRYGKTYYNLLEVKIATNGFKKEEVVFLKKKLEEIYEFPFYLAKDHKTKEQYCIKLTKSSDVYNFLLSLEGSYPEGMERKFDLYKSINPNNLIKFKKRNF